MSDDDRNDRDHGASGRVMDPHGAMADDGPRQAVAVAPRGPVDYDAEREHNRLKFGETYRERYGGRGHRSCIIWCLEPGQRDAKRCPVCYGRHVETRPMDEAPDELEPAPGLRMRFWAWVWRVAGHVVHGMCAPWRAEQARFLDLLRAELESMVIEVSDRCPACAAAEVAGAEVQAPELEQAAP